MREALGLTLSIIVTIVLAGSLAFTLKMYNEYDRNRLTLTEVNELQKVIDSGFEKKLGNTFIFTKGVVDIENNSIKEVNHRRTFKNIKLSYKDIEKVDFKKDGGEVYSSYNLYAITYKFTVNKKVYSRVRVVCKYE